MKAWYIQSDDGLAGPFDSAQLRELAATGKILPTTLVRESTTDRFVPASRVQGLFPSPPSSANVISDDRPVESLEEQGLLASAAKTVKQHTELKKLQWSDLPKAKSILGRKGFQQNIFPDSANHVVESIRKLSNDLQQTKDSEQPNRDGKKMEAYSQIVEGTRDVARRAAQVSKSKLLQRQLRTELVILGDAILTDSELCQSQAIASEITACRQIIERIDILSDEVGPVFDKQMPAKFWSDIKGDASNTGKWIKSSTRLQRLKRMELPRADCVLGKSLLAAKWRSDKTDPIAIQIAEVDRELEMQVRPTESTDMAASGIKARIGRIMRASKQSVRTEILQHKRDSLSGRFGATARSLGSLADIELHAGDDASKSQPSWIEPLRKCQEVVFQIEQLEVERQETKASRIPPIGYLGVGTAAIAVMLTLTIGIWLLSNETEQIASVSNKTNAEVNGTLRKATKGDTVRSSGTGPASAETESSVLASLPKFLPPLPAPNLRLMSDFSNKTEVAVKQPSRPAVHFDFPRKFSGIFHGQIGGGNGYGFLGLDIEIEKLGKEHPDRPYISKSNKQSDIRTRKWVEETGGARFTEYLVNKLPTAFSDYARTIEGTIRVYKIQNPNLNERDRNYLDVRRKEFDSCTFSGWVDPHYRLVSISAKRWAIRKDILVTNFITRLSLQGYWLPEQHTINGWAGSEWNHFFVSDQEKQAEKFLSLAIDVQKEPNQMERNAKNLFDQSLGNARLNRPTAARVNLVTESQKIEKWYRPFNEELSTNPYKKRLGGDIYFFGLGLFASDYFAEHFGKTFEELSYIERHRLILMMREAQGRMPNRDPSKGYDYRDSLIQDLPDFVYENDLAKMYSFLGNHRGKHDWLRYCMKNLNNTSDYDGAFDDYERVSPWRELALQGLLQRERTPKETLFTATQTELAIAKLESWDEPIRGNNDQRIFDSILAVLDEETAKIYRKKAAVLASEQRTRELLDYFDRLVAIKDNADSLKSVTYWIERFHHYRDLQNLPVHQAAHAYALERYHRLLKTYLPKIIYDLDTAENEKNIEKMKMPFAVISSEKYRNSPESKQVEMAVRRNLARLAHERALKFFSLQEQAWMAENTMQITIPNEIPEPTAESIKIAFYREMGNLPGCQWDSPYGVQVSIPPLDRFDIYTGFSLSGVVKVVDPNGRTGMPEGQGFRCYYRFTPSISVPKMGNANDPRQRLLDGLSRTAEVNAQFTTMSDVFVLTRGGWRSPSIRKRGLQGLAMTYQALGEGLENVGRGMSSWPILPGPSARGRIRRVRIGNQIFNQHLPN